MKFYTIKIAYLASIFLTGCSSQREGSHEISCGSNSNEISWRIKGNHEAANQFAIMLNGSPVTQYFSDQSPQSERMVDELVERGFKVFEVKYPTQAGFYSLCMRQGLDNVAGHCGKLYDLAVEKLGFNKDDPKHTLVGVGWSIGAIQLQAMSFMQGKRIDKIALTGVLLGNAEKGCKSYLDGETDGFSWGFFHNLAAALTKNGHGCHKPSEYSSTYNFENLQHFDKWNLALFEGASTAKAGNLAQAQHIAQKRSDVGAPVQLYTYKDCGHELMECTNGKAVEDILGFVSTN